MTEKVTTFDVSIVKRKESRHVKTFGVKKSEQPPQWVVVQAVHDVRELDRDKHSLWASPVLRSEVEFKGAFEAAVAVPGRETLLKYSPAVHLPNESMISNVVGTAACFAFNVANQA